MNHPHDSRKTLKELDRLAADYSPGLRARKRLCLSMLARARFGSARDLARFHEILLFLRAYPDDAGLLRQVESLCEGFARRPDLRRHRAALRDSGIGGTETRYTFFWPTARWLVRRFPGLLSIDWDEFTGSDLLLGRLHLLAHYGETPGLDEAGFDAREWCARMKGAGESDAAFLVRRFEALPMRDLDRETFFQELALPMVLAAGGPDRTHEGLPGAQLGFQEGSLRRGRPVFPDDIQDPPVAVRELSIRAGARVVDLARGAMVARGRDLDAFAYGDSADVRIADFGRGLQFAFIGMIPERRLLLESVYGIVMFKNGVPIGYLAASALFGTSEVAFNVFEAFRGAEAAYLYGRVLAALRHLFASDAFTVYPYQLGQDNDEALRSGSWWFYQKLGFRARDPGVLRLMREELRKMKRDPSHRSGLRTLRELASANVFYHLGRPREDVIGILPLANVGLRVTQLLAARFGSDREAGARVCAKEAAVALGLRSLDGWSRGEKLAFRRWAPLFCLLPGIRGWSRSEKAAALRVVRAKGGRRESDYVRLFDGHVRLRRAVARLCRPLEH